MEDRRRDIRKDLDIKISSIVSSVKKNELLKNHTTFRIGGPASYFVEVQDKNEIIKLRNLSLKEKIPLLILGGGSNVLIDDRGFDGIVARLCGTLQDFSFRGEKLLAGGGAASSAVLKECVAKGLSGLECLAGIPGTIGGAIVGNAGSKTEWIGNVVESVEIISDQGESKEISKKDMEFSYRHSNLEKHIVLKAKLNLKKSLKNDTFNKIEESLLERTKRQPMGSWCAGSVFKNPSGESAGKLIDRCGLKGLTFGGAKISEKHANFIINTGKAKASDVQELITIVRHKVKDKFGVDLELEIKIIE